MTNKIGQIQFTMRPKLERHSDVPTHCGKPKRHRRQLILQVNDKIYADLLLSLERDGINDLSPFFKALIILYVENDPSFRRVIRRVKELMYADNEKYVEKRDEKKLDASQKEQQRIKEKFGLSDDEVEDIFDMLEKDLPNI